VLRLDDPTDDDQPCSVREAVWGGEEEIEEEARKKLDISYPRIRTWIVADECHIVGTHPQKSESGERTLDHF